ncbi:MAG: DoxX family membrane protein [Desulfobacterales bacterium]|nr:MAG: DoxX family membrane protein [Desulfobacterales bacterium]
MNEILSRIADNCWIELAGRWFLGLTFIYASYHKIVAPANFAKLIYGYDLFAGILINPIAIILPFVELVCGLALILGFYPRSAALIINTMLLSFIIILSINLIRGHEFDCGCFSSGRSGYASSTEMTLVRDIIYGVIGLQIFLFRKPRKACIAI